MRKAISHIQWLLLYFFGFHYSLAQLPNIKNHSDPRIQLERRMASFISENPEYSASEFEMPVGLPDGGGYYNAQGFGTNDHLGNDWNGV